MKNTEKAFLWIVDILERNKIEYKISGGFAARIYGVNRELFDIDIEVANANISQIASEAKPFIISGPVWYKDDRWELELMKLVYEGQKIDISGTDLKIFNEETRRWEKGSGSLKNVEMKEVFGKMVPVESLDSLIAYKSKLARDVDLEDVRQLKLLYFK